MSPVWVRPSSLGLGQAEVGDPDDPRGVEQQVRRLDVAVDDAAGMGVGQPLRRLPADLGHAAEERLPAARARPPRAASRPAARPRAPGPAVGPGRGRLRIREDEVRSRAVASRASRSVAAGPVAAAGRMSPDGTGRLRSRTGRSGATGRSGRAPGSRGAGRRRPAAVGPGPFAPLPGFRSDAARAARSSSMTWSSPWPWMNCMA